PRLLGRVLAHDDVPLLERGAQSREVVLGQRVLVREGLDVLLLDEAALGGLLEQALGGREVVQMNRVAQLRSFRLGRAAGFRRPRGGSLRGSPRSRHRPLRSYRTTLHGSPFPNLGICSFRTKS